MRLCCGEVLEYVLWPHLCCLALLLFVCCIVSVMMVWIISEHPMRLSLIRMRIWNCVQVEMMNADDGRGIFCFVLLFVLFHVMRITENRQGSKVKRHISLFC